MTQKNDQEVKREGLAFSGLSCTACLRKDEKLVGCFFGSGASACFRKVEKSTGRFWRAAPALPASMPHPALPCPVIPLPVVWLGISNAV